MHAMESIYQTMFTSLREVSISPTSLMKSTISMSWVFAYGFQDMNSWFLNTFWI